MRPLDFTSEQRHNLLAIARGSLRRALGPEGGQEVDTNADPALRQLAGAFVTLRDASGALRGCIGRTDASEPLADVVEAMAVSAATRDPRFPPVTADELPTLRIEVSVLSPASPCQPSDVVVGRDGLVVQRGARRGLLLPQVAIEQGWDREQFLVGVCRKAGLPAQAWRSGVDLRRFEAVHFQEPS